MIINDLDVNGAMFGLAKTDPPLVIDPDAVLSDAIPFESFEAVTGWPSKIIEFHRRIDHVELPPRDLAEAPPLRRDDFVPEKALASLIGKALDHSIVTRYVTHIGAFRRLVNVRAGLGS